MSEDWKRKVWAKCCICGRPLTSLDYEKGTMIVDEWDNPYTDEVEVMVYNKPDKKAYGFNRGMNCR